MPLYKLGPEYGVWSEVCLPSRCVCGGRDFENETLMKMKRQAERARIIAEMEEEDKRGRS